MYEVVVAMASWLESVISCLTLVDIAAEYGEVGDLYRLLVGTQQVKKHLLSVA